MNKVLSKAVMTRSRLKNRLNNNPSNENKIIYKKFRNYCTNLFRREKKNYYNNLDINLIADNKTFWSTIKPLFSEKKFHGSKIVLVENDKILTDGKDLTRTFNSYFTNTVKNLDIKGFNTLDFSYNPDIDFISNIIEKFRNHPSILMIKNNKEYTCI